MSRSVTTETAPIGPKTVTVLGSHWGETAPWSGFDWSRAELRSGSIWGDDDYHLGVPWTHPDDAGDPGAECIYRVRLKRGWKSFVRIDGVWRVSKAPPTQTAPFGTPPHRQIRAVIEMRV